MFYGYLEILEYFDVFVIFTEKRKFLIIKLFIKSKKFLK